MRNRLLISLTGAAILSVVAGLAYSDGPPAKAKADRTKKEVIERPTEAVVGKKSSSVTDTDNPKVEPGKVHWHATFADACKAAEKSHKPVLLFQMMGNLDERFC
jgi:hypothetical protein